MANTYCLYMLGGQRGFCFQDEGLPYDPKTLAAPDCPQGLPTRLQVAYLTHLENRPECGMDNISVYYY